MKLITPSVEIWKQEPGIEGMWKHIARCTLVCRQAESFREGETAEEFCKRTILAKEPLNNKGNHLAMLEHGTVYLKIPKGATDAYHYGFDRFSVVTSEIGGEYDYVTTNLRVLVEHDNLSDLQYICNPTGYHVKRLTACFITNIGVSREFNRHRVNSIAEESTRYCNYSKDRFDNQITFVRPKWYDLPVVKEEYTDVALRNICNDLFTSEENNFDDITYYIFALKACEYSYNALIKKGWKPQQAREVLPLATKTQLIHTAFINDWQHFFDLRLRGVSGAPHPNAKVLAEELYINFNNFLQNEQES